MAEKETEAQKLNGYFNKELNEVIPTREDLKTELYKINVPVTDNKPDTTLYLSNLNSTAKRIVTNHYGDGGDPDWASFLDEMMGRLRGYPNLYKDDKLRGAVLDALIEEAANKVQQRVISRGVNRGRALPSFGDQKKYNEEVAGGDKALIELIRSSNTPEELLARTSTVHSRKLEKITQDYQLTGKTYS